MSDHKPADYILDEFLGGHQVRTTVAEFSGLLKELRASIAEEIAVAITEAGDERSKDRFQPYLVVRHTGDVRYASYLDAASLARKIGGQS